MEKLSTETVHEYAVNHTGFSGIPTSVKRIAANYVASLYGEVIKYPIFNIPKTEGELQIHLSHFFYTEGECRFRFSILTPAVELPINLGIFTSGARVRYLVVPALRITSPKYSVQKSKVKVEPFKGFWTVDQEKETKGETEKESLASFYESLGLIISDVKKDYQLYADSVARELKNSLVLERYV